MLVSTTLAEVVDSLEAFNEDSCIFARKPWRTDAPAIVALLTDDFRIPAEMTDGGFEYFLEIHVAKEVLKLFENRQPTPQECRDLILYYAENDAYPDWVYG